MNCFKTYDNNWQNHRYVFFPAKFWPAPTETVGWSCRLATLLAHPTNAAANHSWRGRSRWESCYWFLAWEHGMTTFYLAHWFLYTNSIMLECRCVSGLLPFSVLSSLFGNTCSSTHKPGHVYGKYSLGKGFLAWQKLNPSYQCPNVRQQFIDGGNSFGVDDVCNLWPFTKHISIFAFDWVRSGCSIPSIISVFNALGDISSFRKCSCSPSFEERTVIHVFHCLQDGIPSLHDTETRESQDKESTW